MARKDQLKFTVTAIDKTKATFRTIGMGLSKLGGIAKSAGLAATGVGAAFAFMLKKTADGIDETGKLSRQLGMSVKALETFKHAAEIGGSSLDTLARASKQLSKNTLDFVVKGTGEAADSFKLLGLSASDLRPVMNDSVALMSLIGDKFNEMPEGAVKTAAAYKLFGSRATEMINVLEGGSQAFNKFSEDAERFGLVLEEKQVKAVENANDELVRFGGVIRGIAKQMTAELFPKIGEIATQLREKILKSIENSYGSVRNLGKDLADRIAAASKFAALNILKAVKGITTGILTITKAMTTALNLFIQGVEELAIALMPFKEMYEKGLTGFFFGGGFGTGVEDPRLEQQERQKKIAQMRKGTMAKSLTGMEQGIAESIENTSSYFDTASKWIEDFSLKDEKVRETSKVVGEQLEKNKTTMEQTPAAANEITNALERMKGSAEKAGDIIANNFEDAIFKAKSFEDSIKSIADELARLAFREAVTKPFAEFISSSISGLMSPVDTKAASIASAKGNAFMSGKLLPFANGGIVSTPTSFALAGSRGLMAEAGSEAILPLKRSSSGVLGVESSGSGSKVSVNIIDQRSTGAAAQVSEERGQDGSRSINVVIRDEVKRGFA